uniref:A disintegrin and metalloproteinase with thrombospondin motifs adt-1-like n=1 Tax=Styela clava TaxID=7725 RepID=UPI001939F8D0|nr:A disintegrin and metalloproteinase with thrombospondin motifs adt-1-like [Styela clava]
MQIRLTILLLCLTLMKARAEEEECKDKVSYCKRMKSFCDHATYKQYMLDNCIATCKKCRKDIDPDGLCLKDNGGCEHTCDVEDKTIKKCSCFSGYTLKKDGLTCTDVDECTIKGICLRGKHCTNVEGGFFCDEAKCTNPEKPYLGRPDCCTKEPDTAECGVTARGVERIVGGNDSFLGQWPWQVYINIDTSIICGGTLINRNWVVTAGHCFKGFSSETKMELFFGVLELSKLKQGHVQKRNMKKHILYPNWNEDKFEINDIALIELDKPVRFNRWVRPVCLPNGEKPKIGTKCYAAGWGLQHEDDLSPATKLQHVDLPIVEPQKCIKAYKDEDTKVNRTIMMCAGYDEGGKDSCRGDSGGPFVCQRCNSCGWYLAGVVSFGSGCAQKGFYGVYADVHYFEKWISEMTKIPVNNAKSCTGPYMETWSKWSTCTVTCGIGGKHTRTRQCLHKGKVSDQCNGPLKQTDDCPRIRCPRFGRFSDWSKCTKTCGGGLRTRIRECLHGKIGQDGCPADDAVENEDCNKQTCPVWEDWSEWKTCTKTCGTGVEARTRKCIGGKPSDEGCDGKATEERKCNEELCPGWSDWGPFGRCSKTCGGGTQVSERQCIGKKCPGEDNKSQVCNKQLCPVFGKWSNWESCDVTCGGGLSQRRRSCENGKIGEIGCEKDKESEQQKCNTQLCPEFTSWSDFTKCSVTCGGGTQKATRTCKNGRVGQEGCIGDTTKTRKCGEDECIGNFGTWSVWTKCSETCGNGIRTRSRSCEGGTKCIGKSQESEDCKVKECPVFGKWSQWTVCSNTCGGGQQSRSRDCLHTNNPEDCVGEASQSQNCNEQRCPGVWMPWTEWSECDVTCGEGTETKTRNCEGGEIGKPNCDSGEAEETRRCVLDACPSKWGNWGTWTFCSKSCDRGMKTRRRPCDGGKPGDGDCVPASAQKEEEACNEVTCRDCFDVAGFTWCATYFTIKENCKEYPAQARQYCALTCSLCPGLHEHWQSWGPCSSSCGTGFRTRTRECKNKELGCEGESSEEDVCKGPCQGFNPWGKWTTCTESCNGGTRTRQRTCSFKKCDPDENGNTSKTDKENCNLEPCPGKWGDWGAWESCSTTCGDNGEQIARRTCEGGRAGGPGCLGLATKTRPCRNNNKCPGKWSAWTKWSQCSVTCGGKGTRTRTRTCEGGVEGQSDCPGSATQTEDCDEEKCTAKWGDWEDWGDCDKDCSRTRTRKCIGGTKGDRGCEGEGEQTQECDSSQCPTDGCDPNKIDLHIWCNSLTTANCYDPQYEQACPWTCCKVLGQVPCEDDPAQKDSYCVPYQAYCNDPTYIATFKQYCRKTCNFCE